MGLGVLEDNKLAHVPGETCSLLFDSLVANDVCT